MTSAPNASIVPHHPDRQRPGRADPLGPPWEDEDGEEWQGFLGDGAKILMSPATGDCANSSPRATTNDLSDHPAWPGVRRLDAEQLRPGGDDAYDLDEVYTVGGREPDPMHVSALANVVDMVGKIADCCDDGALRSLVIGTAAYEELVDDDVSYPRPRRPQAMGRTRRPSSPTLWETRHRARRPVAELAGRLRQRRARGRDVWDRVGAEPIEIVLADATLPDRARLWCPFRSGRGSDPVGRSRPALGRGRGAVPGQRREIVFFHHLVDLAEFCRAATEHELVRLERWTELADVEDDKRLRPTADASYDLTVPSEKALDLVAELLDFCDLDADLTCSRYQQGEQINRAAWNSVVAESAPACTQKTKPDPSRQLGHTVSAWRLEQRRARIRGDGT